MSFARLISALFLILIAAFCIAANPPAEADKFWPQWRGPLSSGVAPAANPPVEWSESKNIKWKMEIPGKGSATPIVWGDRIFLLTAIPTDKALPPKVEEAAPAAAAPRKGGGPSVAATQVHQFAVLAINRKDGKVLWQKILREELPHEGTHPTGTFASGSAMTDGTLVFAFFGSRGLYCLDFNGNLKWQKDFGKMTIKMGFGEGASPVLAGDKIIVNWDHEAGSFITALDKKTGNELWRTKRDESTAWATPLVVGYNGKQQVVTSASGKVRSYDLDNGALLWESTGMTANVIPSPVTADGMVYLTSGFRGNALLAVKLAAAKGDITNSAEAIAWRYDRDTPYVPSPLLYNGTLYILKSNNGVLTAFDAKSGQLLYGPTRLDAVPNVYASPLGAAGHIYIAGREGTVAVLDAGKEFKVLATNTLDDAFDASPIAVENDLYLRGKKFLYCIAKN